jgi:superfamily II DNA or RNA helicase
VLEITFEGGTLALRAAASVNAAALGDALALAAATLGPALQEDARSDCHRAKAVCYADLITALTRAKLPFEDRARRYETLALRTQVDRTPRDYQLAAVKEWTRARGRGVVVLPTGAGKTQVAIMAMAEKQRSTLVVAPTLELVRQWHDLLRATFGVDIGIVGGGSHKVLPITVTTYDSAYLHMDHLGNRFGFIVFDECHHLPSHSYALAAEGCLAPYRLGLTATPERSDLRDSRYADLIGTEVYRRDIVDLAGEYLAPYEVETVSVGLTADERKAYDEERALYKAFIAKHGIRMGSAAGFGDFIARSSRSEEGRRAMKAFRNFKRIAFAPAAKLDYLEHLLDLHRDERTILFTQDNRTAYEIGERFLVPVITHHTRIRERSDMLSKFRAGTYTVLSTSKVLNEGVDVPEASVAVVLSGSGSVREHVQRLGRVLRKQEGKAAILYELVTSATSEEYTSERRREHSAYR